MSTDIRSTIVIEGQDQFSAVFGKLDKAAKNAGDSMSSAASRSAALAERAGDAERGFIGLKDIIGGMATGPLQEVADRMGGIEAVIKGFGPAAAGLTLALGAAALVASQMYERAEKARKAALDVEIQRLEQLQGDNEALARHLAISGELLGVKSGIATVEQVIGTAQGHARDIAKNQQAILEAQKEKETEKIALLEREQATLRGLLAVDELRLQRAKEAANVAAIASGETAARTRENEEAEDKINAIMDVRERLRVRDWYRQQQQVQLQAEQASLGRRAWSTGAEHEAIEKRRLEIHRELRGLTQQEMADAQAGAAYAAQRNAERSAAASAAVARAKEQREAERKAIDAYYQAQTELEASLTAQQTERANRLIALEDKIRQAKEASAIAGAGSAIERVDLQARFAAERLEAERQKALQVQADRAEEGAAMLREIEARGVLEAQKFAADRVRAEQEVQQAKDATAQKARDTAAAERAARLESIDMATATASAVVAGLEQVGIAEQAAAGLKAGIAFAEAGLAAARGNWAGAVAGVASGIQFGKVALSGGSAPPPGIGGGGMGTGGAQQQGSTGGGMGGAVVINFNKGFYGDAASTAKGIAGTLKTIGSSGIPAWRGA